MKLLLTITALLVPGVLLAACGSSTSLTPPRLHRPPPSSGPTSPLTGIPIAGSGMKPMTSAVKAELASLQVAVRQGGRGGRAAIMTAAFQTTGTWAVSYTVQCRKTSSGAGGIRYSIISGSATIGRFSSPPLAARIQTRTYLYHSTGAYYLLIHSACTFSLSVAT